ncbi:MAG: MBL fold metallo-hydrolase [Candidatus Thorarchaeota archaeon]
MPSLRVAKHRTGIRIKYGDVSLALDTGISGTTTLLSHAHADHIGNLEDARHIIATQETIDALNARGGRIQSGLSTIGFNDTIGQIGVYITALNAGHVIGSTMFKLVFDDGLTVLYTGDFNASDSVVHKAAVPIDADVLITEATYGTPQWVFPRRELIHNDIITTARQAIESGRIPIFHAYSLGKAQEAIALLANSGIDVVSGNPAVDAVSEIYTKYGIELRYANLEDVEVKTTLKQGCAIVTSAPRHAISNVRKMIGPSFAKDLERRKQNYNLSGWTLGEYRNGGFPLSAHTDFPNLLEFAEKVNPRIVYCFTSNAGVFSGYLIQKGISAVPLE